MANESASGARNYGIDLFRCVSMLMVVTLHTLNRGGALTATASGSAENAAAWFLEAAAYGAVDSYALISGYVGWNRKWRPSRILSVWVQVMFYTLGLAAIFIPTGLWAATDEALRYSFFPIFTGHYWYITAYIATMMIAPFLNAGIARVTGREAAVFASASFVLFMILPQSLDMTPFGLAGGYSVLWLMTCYIFGGLISRFRVGADMPKWSLLLIFLLMTTTTCVSRLMGSVALFSYISPTVFVGSAALCVMFSKLNIKNKFAVGTIKLFSPAALGVYIIHVNYFIWRLYMKDFAVGFAGGGVLRFCALVIGAACAIYLVLSAVEMLRICLFRLLRIDKLIKLVDKAVTPRGGSAEQ